MGDVHTVRLPTYMEVSKRLSKPLNLNLYRNLHHHHLNKQKQNFHDVVKPLLRHIPRAEKIWVHYTIFAPRNGRLDTMNVGSILDKYFMDTMVEAGKIPDDDYSHVVLNSFSFGGVCPMDGHAIATIHILERETPMRVILDQEDIQTALDTYVQTMGITGATGVELTVNDDGEVEAEVLIGEAKAAPKKHRGGRPRGSKNKPKPTTEDSNDEVTEDADDDSEDGSDGTNLGGGDASTDTTPAGEGESEEGETEQAKTKTEEAPKSTTGGTKKGNLFADEDDQSSESAESDSSEKAALVVKTKKSSIFDAD